MISQAAKDAIHTLKHIVEGTDNSDLTVEERNAIATLAQEYKDEVERADNYFKHLWLICNEFPHGQVSIHQSSISAYDEKAKPTLSFSSGEAVDGTVVTAFYNTEEEDEIS